MPIRSKQDSCTERLGVAVHKHQHLLRATVLATMAVILGGPTIVWAQSAESTLRGHAQPNAVITAKNVETGATRHTTASNDGSYTLAGLPPGNYHVDAGSGTEADVTLSVSSTETYDFVQNAARKAELAEVVVSGTRLQEVRTSEVGEAGMRLRKSSLQLHSSMRMSSSLSVSRRRCSA